jgi:deoxyribonuclease V
MDRSGGWPSSASELRRRQLELGQVGFEPWSPPPRPYRIGGCFACFGRGIAGRGWAGERGWAAAAVAVGSRVVGRAVVPAVAGASYERGLLALREGPALEAAVLGLPLPPAVLLVDATGRDHPRRAGLALELGAVIGVPSVGVTHRPLVGEGSWPEARAGARSPVVIGDEVVACWLRTLKRARPLVVHPGWRTDLEVACAVVLAATGRVRTPEPLREARRLARVARAVGG